MKLRDIIRSFLKGVSHLTFWPPDVKPPKTQAEIEEECHQALEADWHNVGNDIKKALSEFKKQNNLE